ncbi:MAG: hypothetical protein KGV44_06695 [Flavobacteriaceae bacterium]|nr:hypothetical protein [Flavobacteriaceae bacterium]
MKQKFSFKSLLMAFVALGLVVTTFTSCNNNDDEIKSLETKVAELQKTLKGDLDTKVGAVNKAVEDAKKAAAEASKKAEDAVANGASPAEVKKANDKAKEAHDKAVAIEKKAAELKEDIKKLKSDVEKGVKQKDVDALEAKITNLEVKIADLSKDSGKATLTSLVLLPDTVADKGGALPVINVAPLKSDNCANVAPKVKGIKYVVNPSTVTTADIKKVTFRYNSPKVAAKGAAKKEEEAKNFKVENGLLIVDFELDATKISGTADRINEVMTEVHLTSGAVVSSDWARLNTKERSLLLVKPKESATVDYKELAKTKTLAEGSDPLFNLVYDGELDLAKKLAALYADDKSNITLADYGFTISVDEIDSATNKTIVYPLGTEDGAEATDQNRFIKVSDKGVLTTDVYDATGNNEAAIGRTPIVHVVLKGKNGCVAREGYVKIKITEKADQPTNKPAEIVVTPEDKTMTVGCDGAEVRIGTQEMNEKFYHEVTKLGLSKIKFHNKYTVVTNSTVGTIKELKGAGETGTYNLLFTMTKDELYTALGDKNTKQIPIEVKYTTTDSAYPDFKITFNVNVNREKVELNVAYNNYFAPGFAYTTKNVRTPDAGEKGDGANCTYKSDINNAFHTDASGRLEGLKAGYTYEYVFAETQPMVAGKQLKASADGKTLEVDGGVEIVKIEGTDLAYQDNPTAKELLNSGYDAMRANIQIKVKNNCTPAKKVNFVEKNIGGDTFEVRFLRPINIKGQSGDDLYDANDFGDEGSYVDMLDVVQLSDWRNKAKDTEDFSFSKNDNYYSYYGVTGITVDTNNIKVTGLKVGGVAVEKLPSSIEVKQVSTFNGKTAKFGFLTYRNNGNNLTEPFTMEVPVTVTYKWGEVKSERVTVNVFATKKGDVTGKN